MHNREASVVVLTFMSSKDDPEVLGAKPDGSISDAVRHLDADYLNAVVLNGRAYWTLGWNKEKTEFDDHITDGRRSWASIRDAYKDSLR